MVSLTIFATPGFYKSTWILFYIKLIAYNCSILNDVWWLCNISGFKFMKSYDLEMKKSYHYFF